MDIMKFEILSDGDTVDKVIDNKIHVRKKNGAYHIYTLIFDEKQNIIDFNVLIIKKGFGSFDITVDADLEDLKEAEDDTNE